MSNARAWGRSIENLLKDEAGLKMFKAFMKEQQGNDDNIDFWRAVEKFRSSENKEEMQKQANNIFKCYVTNNSRRCVKIQSATRSKVDLDIKAGPTRYMFDPAQTEILNLLQEPYQEFLKTEPYQKLLL